MEPTDDELDALLRRARPEPDGAWVHATGERLFAGGRRRERRPAWRLGGALAGGLAAFATALSLAGVGPLADGGQTVNADDDCRAVTVTRMQRVPSLSTGAGGLEITYIRKPVRITEQRCG